MLIPVVLIPVFTLAFFFLTWQGGLSMGIEKNLLPVIFGLPVAVSFLVIAIIVIVRLCRKMPVLLLVQVLVMEIIALSAFFILDYKKNTWLLNQYLYQDKREAFVKRIQSNPNPGNEAAMMDSVQQHRNYHFFITLLDDEECLQNRRSMDTLTRQTISSVGVQRDCDGNLTVKFDYDEMFFGATFSVLYSDRLPRVNEMTSWDVNGIPRTTVYHSIDKYTVMDTIAPHWYYVQDASGGFHLDFSGGWGGGGGGASSSGGSSGGCQ